MDSSGTLLKIEEISLSPHDNAVIVETNRWKPDRCMWIAERERIRTSGIRIIFPFPELWDSICHILIGTADDYCCYIHLTPLTSLFRTYTNELEKIALNLDREFGGGKKRKWQFQIYYLPDSGREEKFRSLIAKVLGEGPVKFFQLVPRGDVRGELNLVYLSGRFYYSIQDMQRLLYKDAAAEGFFNRVPIEAIE
jgi:hypothetical protein